MQSNTTQSYNDENAQIVALLCEGFMPKQIAQQVRLSELAVRSRLFRIRRKEGVDSNIGLVGKVLEARWNNQRQSRGAA
jgi:DNA-binding NarL/FixJ family response regulator